MELKKHIYGKHQQDCFYEITGIAPSVCPGTHASGPHLLKILVTPKLTNTQSKSMKGTMEIKKIGNIYKGQNGEIFSPQGISPSLRAGVTNNPKHGGIGSSNSPKILEDTKTMETAPKSTGEMFPALTCSSEASLARRLVSQVKDLDLTTPEALSSLKSQGLLKKSDQSIFYLKMLKDCYLTTLGELSKPSSPRLQNWGMTFNGKCLTARISASHRIGKECSLSDVLEEKVSDKYFLSEKQLITVLYKKSPHPEIKWKSGIKGEGAIPFPEDLNKPARTVMTSESGNNRMTHGILTDVKSVA